MKAGRWTARHNGLKSRAISDSGLIPHRLGRCHAKHTAPKEISGTTLFFPVANCARHFNRDRAAAIATSFAEPRAMSSAVKLFTILWSWYWLAPHRSLNVNNSLLCFTLSLARLSGVDTRIMPNRIRFASRVPWRRRMRRMRSSPLYAERF